MMQWSKIVKAKLKKRKLNTVSITLKCLPALYNSNQIFAYTRCMCDIDISDLKNTKFKKVVSSSAIEGNI